MRHQFLSLQGLIGLFRDQAQRRRSDGVLGDWECGCQLNVISPRLLNSDDFYFPCFDHAELNVCSVAYETYGGVRIALQCGCTLIQENPVEPGKPVLAACSNHIGLRETRT